MKVFMHLHAPKRHNHAHDAATNIYTHIHIQPNIIDNNTTPPINPVP